MTGGTEAAATYHVRLLGCPEVWADGRPISLGRRRALAILAVVLWERRPVSRAQLATMLWTDARDPAANLRPVLSELRRAVPGLLAIDRTVVRPAHAPGTAVDLYEVTDAVPGLGAQTEPEALASLSDLVAGAGDLLDGFELSGAEGFERWLDVARVQTRSRLGTVRRAIVRAHLGRGNPDAALAVVDAVAAASPYDEAANDEVVDVLEHAGRRQEAADRSSAFRRRLAVELGVRPTAAVAIGRPAHRPSVEAPDEDLLFGRRREVELGIALLRRSRLVTVTGPGGIGKSRVGRAVARRAGSASGVVHVDLGSAAGADDVAHRVASAIHLQTATGAMVPQVVEAVADLDVLLLLDGGEQVGDVVRDLVDQILDGGRSARVLVLARRPLGALGEVTIELGRLSPGAARTLFVHHSRLAGARRAPTGIEVDVVDEVCARLEGHALAIIVAARLGSWRGHDDLTPVLRTIVSGLDLHDEGTALGAVGALVDATAELLPEHARRVLDVLGTFPGSADAHAVAALADLPVAEVVPLLDVLRAHSLVAREPAPDGSLRWRPPRTVAAHLRHRAGLEHDRLVVRHAELLHARVADLDMFDLRHADRVEVIAADLEDHAQAFEQLVGTGRWIEASEVALGSYATFSCRAWTSRGRAWLERCLAAEAHLPPGLVERVRFDLMKLCLVLDDRRGVEEHGARLEGALDPRIRSEAASTRAVPLLQTEPERAADLLGRAQSVLEGPCPPGSDVWPRAYVGIQAMYAGDLTRALSLLDASIGEARQLGHTNHLWTLEDAAATCVLLLGRPAEVVRRLADVARPDTFWDARDLLLGLAHLDLGDLDAGRRSVLAFADPVERRRLPRSANDALVGLARLAAEEGHVDHAVDLLGSSGRGRMPASIGVGRSLAARLGVADRVQQHRVELEAAGRLYASADDLLEREWRAAVARSQVERTL